MGSFLERTQVVIYNHNLTTKLHRSSYKQSYSPILLTFIPPVSPSTTDQTSLSLTRRFMWLEFCYSIVILAPGHTRDDIHLYQTATSKWTRWAHSSMTSTWRFATLSKEFVVQTSKRSIPLGGSGSHSNSVSPLGVNWWVRIVSRLPLSNLLLEGNQKYNILMGLLVDSGRTCHNRTVHSDIRAAPPEPRRL